jgi:predicted nucleic acid-binding protein
MKKVIIDTNLWISFLIGHQTRIVKLADFKEMLQY